MNAVNPAPYAVRLMATVTVILALVTITVSHSTGSSSSGRRSSSGYSSGRQLSLIVVQSVAEAVAIG